MSYFLKQWYRLLQKSKDDIITYYHYRGGWRLIGKFHFLERDFKEILEIDGEINEPKIGFKRPRKIE
jgi:hypothetical protein